MIFSEIKNIKSSRHDLRHFGLIVGGIFVVLSLYFWWKGKNLAGFFLLVGILLEVFGALAPVALRPFHKMWMTAGILLGWIMTNVILTLFFYLVITLFALIAKLVGKRFLDTGFGQAVPTYWRKRESREASRVDMEKQF